MTMYTTGYGLFLSEGQYEEKSHTFIGFSLNKEELEEKIQKLEREFEVFKIEFESQSINIDTYISKFNNDWTKFASQNVNPHFKYTLMLPINKPVTKEEHKEWCRIKDVNNRAGKFNNELVTSSKRKFLIDWMAVHLSGDLERFIQITYGTELRKIFIGSCPHFFVVEMNDSF